jgi:hypothetical protein
VRQTKTGRLLLDRAKIKAEQHLDGKYLLPTSDPDLSAEDVALWGYENLLEAERGFRDLKSTLELRPVLHRVKRRIRVHILLCWLALLLSASPNVRLPRHGDASRWSCKRLHLVTLTGPTGTAQHNHRARCAAQSALTSYIDPGAPRGRTLRGVLSLARAR